MKKITYALMPVLLLSLQGGTALAAGTTDTTVTTNTAPKMHGVGMDAVGRNTQIAALIGITTEELTASLTSGKSLQDIISAKGLSLETILSKIQAARAVKMTTQIDADVASGKITAAQAAEMKSHVQNMPKKNDAGTTPKTQGRANGMGMMGGMKAMGGPRNGEGLDALAKILGTTTADLQAQMKAGKKIDDIITAKGLKPEDVKKQLDALRPKNADGTVNTAGKGMGMMNGDMMGRGKGPIEALAKVLGTTPAELQAQMKAGKTIDDITKEKGLTKEAVMKQLDALRPARPINDGQKTDQQGGQNGGRGMRGGMRGNPTTGFGSGQQTGTAPVQN